MAVARWIGSTAAVDETGFMRVGIAVFRTMLLTALRVTQLNDSLWTSTHRQEVGMCKALSGRRTAAHKKTGDLLCKLDVVSALGV